MLCPQLSQRKTLTDDHLSAFAQRQPLLERNQVPTFSTPSIPKRMACWTYEGILMFGVAFLADYLFSTLSQTRHALDNRHAQQAFLFVVFGIYFVWFWAKGQTLAMKTWDIRVVDVYGAPIDQKRALLRYVLSWMWFLPPLLFSWLFVLPGKESAVLIVGWIAVWAVLARFQAQRQFWHDAWSGTQLVNWVAPESPKRAARMTARTSVTTAPRQN
jgi:uncharacterized RDD family membrane protein YckC